MAGKGCNKAIQNVFMTLFHLIIFVINFKFHFGKKEITL